MQTLVSGRQSARLRRAFKELQGRAAEKLTVDCAWIMSQLVEVATVAVAPEDIKTAGKLEALDTIIKMAGEYAPEKRVIAGNKRETMVRYAKLLPVLKLVTEIFDL
jgi:hypothetical protein